MNGPKGHQAPELFLGWTHDFSVDCWGFGVLLYMMVYGSVSRLLFCVYQVGKMNGLDYFLQHPISMDTNESATDLERTILHGPMPSFPQNANLDSAGRQLITKAG